MAPATARITRLIKSAACSVLAMGMVACSSTPNSRLVQDQPASNGPSAYAVASAEGGAYAQPYSLVAADSVGLAAFGEEVAQWSMPADPQVAQAEEPVNTPGKPKQFALRLQ